jgi:hypothetical protein
MTSWTRGWSRVREALEAAAMTSRDAVRASRWMAHVGRTIVALAALVVALAMDAAPSDAGSPHEVVFAPAPVLLANARSSDAPPKPSSLTIEVTAFDDRGERIEPTAERPIRIEISGGRRDAVTPRETSLTSGSTLTLTYDGGPVASPITVTAWTDQPGGVRKSLGRTQLLPQNPVDCRYGNARRTLRVLCEDGGSVESCALAAIRRGLKVRAAVGWSDPQDQLQPFGVDTGSIGTVVPVERLGPDAIGPGAPGRVYYDSSGRIFSGSYYLASVAFETEDGSIVRTPRMMVLGIDSASCVPGHPDCRPSDDPGLHYLGVGFARGSAEEHKLVSPADNAFLRVADAGDGAMSPGYVLTGRGITLGIPALDGYLLAALAPSTSAPGDWSAARGCYAFPELPAPNRFCGNFLLDVGIAEMFLDLPVADRPPGSAASVRCGERECASVPEGTAMRVTVGPDDRPALSYDFTLRRDPVGPEPTYARWIDRQQVFMNVGRRPLFRFHYLFDATCGNVGFARVD